MSSWGFSCGHKKARDGAGARGEPGGAQSGVVRVGAVWVIGSCTFTHQLMFMKVGEATSWISGWQ
jgi:hypothetical protein